MLLVLLDFLFSAFVVILVLVELGIGLIDVHVAAFRHVSYKLFKYPTIHLYQSLRL